MLTDMHASEKIRAFFSMLTVMHAWEKINRAAHDHSHARTHPLCSAHTAEKQKGKMVFAHLH